MAGIEREPGRRFYAAELPHVELESFLYWLREDFMWRTGHNAEPVINHEKVNWPDKRTIIHGAWIDIVEPHPQPPDEDVNSGGFVAVFVTLNVYRFRTDRLYLQAKEEGTAWPYWNDLIKWLQFRLHAETIDLSEAQNMIATDRRPFETRTSAHAWLYKQVEARWPELHEKTLRELRKNEDFRGIVGVWEQRYNREKGAPFAEEPIDYAIRLLRKRIRKQGKN